MHNHKNFNDIYKNNPQIHSCQYFKQFYTDSILFTPFVRTNWVSPILKQL